MTSQGTEEVGQVLAHLCSPPDLQKKKGGAEGLPLAVFLPCARWNTQHLIASASGSRGIFKDPRKGQQLGPPSGALHAETAPRRPAHAGRACLASAQSRGGGGEVGTSVWRKLKSGPLWSEDTVTHWVQPTPGPSPGSQHWVLEGHNL